MRGVQEGYNRVQRRHNRGINGVQEGYNRDKQYNILVEGGYGNIILPDDGGDESDDESSQESEQSSQDSQSSEEIDSSQEEKEGIDQDEVTSRHEAKLEALINEYEQHGDSSDVARVKAENSLLPVYRKFFWIIYSGCMQ
ncbi:hypothetical protein ACROYT_G039932 [Oculina patagonica]